jgi:hypothetical protein
MNVLIFAFNIPLYEKSSFTFGIPALTPCAHVGAFGMDVDR